MPSLWRRASHRGRRKVFHCLQLTQIVRNPRSLGTIHLQIPSLVPLEMRKVQPKHRGNRSRSPRTRNPATCAKEPREGRKRRPERRGHRRQRTPTNVGDGNRGTRSVKNRRSRTRTAGFRRGYYPPLSGSISESSSQTVRTNKSHTRFMIFLLSSKGARQNDFPVALAKSQIFW